MSKFSVPDNVQIASLKKKQQEVIDLLAHGKGNAWEDRGSVGVVSAFFKTAIAGMFSPVKLLSDQRRPETPQDARSFAIVCCVLWGVGVITQSALTYFLFLRTNLELDTQQYMINTGLEALAAGVGAFVLLKLASTMFHKMSQHDMRVKATPVIINNTMSYLMAPSILAVIPFGAAIALPWILVIWIVAGSGRLKIKLWGAIVASVLTFLACMAIVTASYFLVGRLLWVTILDKGSLPSTPASSTTVGGAASPQP